MLWWGILCLVIDGECVLKLVSEATRNEERQVPNRCDRRLPL